MTVLQATVEIVRASFVEREISACLRHDVKHPFKSDKLPGRRPNMTILRRRSRCGRVRTINLKTSGFRPGTIPTFSRKRD